MKAICVTTIATLMSVGFSSVVVILLLPSISRLLLGACRSQDGVAFWSRFTVLMLFLGPLIITLAFGAPRGEVIDHLQKADVIVQCVTAALVGQFLALGGIGARLATLRVERKPDAALEFPGVCGHRKTAREENRR